MEIRLQEGPLGLNSALLGLGLSYGLTCTGCETWADLTDNVQERLEKVAMNLAKRGNGENKYLRQILYIWDVRAPRFWWCEADQYRIAVTTQSESTMHTLGKRDLVQDDFESEIYPETLLNLNKMIRYWRETKDKDTFLEIKCNLPEGFLQRRIWSLNLQNMVNIYHQRANHKLPQWYTVCDAFVEATPSFLRGELYS